jgi:hypothetical protein
VQPAGQVGLSWQVFGLLSELVLAFSSGLADTRVKRPLGVVQLKDQHMRKYLKTYTFPQLHGYTVHRLYVS